MGRHRHKGPTGSSTRGAALALSVSSRTQCCASAASGGSCATLTDGPGATKLMRRKVQPPSSLLETFLLVQSGTSSTFGQPEASS